ncbi:MAG: molybdopterin oxidoreductase family protein [Proteobacteria bacterium]|nr:molybdopterin oxidoreductase family protein [Pseudomonadota bacterium]
MVFSVCPHDCPSTCALEIERLDGRTIGRVRGAAGNPYTAGKVCEKVARYAERVHHPDRLRTPLRRKGAKGAKRGGFTPISWDSALDEIAEAFGQATARHGPEAVWPYYYAGTMGRLQRDGINRLRHVMGYSRQKKTICTGLVNPGWLAGIGAIMGGNPHEMAEADLLIIWGTNAVATQVNVMHHVSRARKERGARLIVVDPYRTATAQAADLHICPRPGTDGALACAMMHVLFAEGYADREYMARHADVPGELEAHLQTRTPEWAAGITGLAAEEIAAFAREYGKTKRAFIRVGYGMSRQRNGSANVHAVTCLPTVTGKWPHKGAGAFFSNSDAYHLDQTLIEGLDVRDLGVRELDMSRIGAVLCGDPQDIGGGPPVTAMIVQNTNPMTVAPDHNKVRQGFAREDLFVAVHEQFMTETAAVADIVLPATTFLEHDDVYVGGGHSYLMAGPKVIEPYAESRSNHEVIGALAKRLGARHRGFAMTAWEILDETLRDSGWPGADELRAERWIDCQPDFETAHFLNGFPTPDGKFHFAPDWDSLGPDGAVMPRLPDHLAVIEESDAAHPFRLVTAPARGFLNSSFTETPTSRKREKRPTLMIHPEAAREQGIAEGDLVRLGNGRGEVLVHAKLFDGLQQGVVVVEGVWPNAAFEGGIGINALTGADAGPPNGGAAFHDTAIWIRPAP